MAERPLLALAPNGWRWAASGLWLLGGLLAPFAILTTYLAGVPTTGDWALPFLLAPSVPMIWHAVALPWQQLLVYPDRIVYKRKLRHEYRFRDIRRCAWTLDGIAGIVMELKGRRTKAKIRLHFYIPAALWTSPGASWSVAPLRSLRDLVERYVSPEGDQ